MTSKYKNIKIASFDSKLEYSHYLQLKTLEKAGLISNLQRQVKIPLSDIKNYRVIYIADFVYYDNQNQVITIFDSKGVKTDTFRIKRAWLFNKYCNFVFKTAYKNEIEIYKADKDITKIDISQILLKGIK